MNRTKIIVLFLFLTFLPCAWSTVFIEWSNATVPSANSLGVADIVVSWKGENSAALMAIARKSGYRVYVETLLEQATKTARACAKTGCAGVILNVPDAETSELESTLARLKSAYPKLNVLVLNPSGKQPDMRGSLIIKRDSILEVSSPTAQPWIDTNLALIKVEQRSRPSQVPLYAFPWDAEGQPGGPSAADYSLAIAEAAASHADLVLKLDERLQRALNNHDSEAWAVWNQVRSMIRFSVNRSKGDWDSAANVAVALDRLDANDEVLNLLSRHNIPFRVFLAEDLKKEVLKGFDLLITFLKPDKEIDERITNFASRGMTVVIVDAHNHHPWQENQEKQINEHTTSYAVGNGKILELSEPVPDPEVFAQDIRRLLGKSNALLSLWNGLTTIALPYKDRSGMVKLLELVNYSGDPVQVQVRVKGSFTSVSFESPQSHRCESLAPVKHDGFTEFVIPELTIAGRVHLEP